MRINIMNTIGSASDPIGGGTSTCKGCDVSNTNQNPVINYQRQQKIWNTCRVSASEYLMNVAAVTVYEEPLINRVNWNQSSDRIHPHIQKATVPSHGNSTKKTITCERPGACTPGGIGCDIKHNSYVRYLNRLKGRFVKRGYISPVLTKLIAKGDVPFDPAFPMYGGKYYKTSIVNCRCEIENALDIPGPVRPHFERPTQYHKFKRGDKIQWDPLTHACHHFGIIMDIFGNSFLISYIDVYGKELGKYAMKDLAELKNVRLYEVCLHQYPCIVDEPLNRKDIYSYFQTSLKEVPIKILSF